jgi:hypothetical protein
MSRTVATWPHISLASPARQLDQIAILDSPRSQSTTGFWGCSWGLRGERFVPFSGWSAQPSLPKALRQKTFRLQPPVELHTISALVEVIGAPQRRIRAVSAPHRFLSNEQS